jgi:hypothetical protein
VLFLSPVPTSSSIAHTYIKLDPRQDLKHVKVLSKKFCEKFAKLYGKVKREPCTGSSVGSSFTSVRQCEAALSVAFILFALVS